MCNKNLMKKFALRAIGTLMTVVTIGGSFTSAAVAENISAPVVVGAESEEVTILGEEEALRGEFEKHFVNSDGTYTAVTYEKPVHTLVDGEWEEIDNTLVEQDGELVNRDGLMDVTFADTDKEEESKLVSIEKDGYKISWTMIAEIEDFEEPEATKYISKSILKNKKDEEKSKKVSLNMKGKQKARIVEDKLTGLSKEDKKTVAKKMKSEVAYEGLFCDNVDVKYTLISDSVKEDIVLNERTDIDTFVMEMDLTGLTPEVQEDNSIVFYNNKKEQIFIMPAPFMTDEANGYSEDIEVKVEKSRGKYLLYLTPDREWLDSEERVYPVTIDPTVSPSNAASNVEDTYVYAGNATKHYNERYMYVGLKDSKVHRMFIKFTTMPTIGGSITSAKMNITAASGTTTYGTMKIYQINQSWNSETVTWANQPTSLTYKNLGVRSGYNISFTVTSVVKTWYSGNAYGNNKNYGFAIKYSDETYNDYNMFYTSEASANKPLLTIVYEPSDNPNYASSVLLNSKTSSNISYGGQVHWYKFIPSDSGYYTIYTSGTTDMVGKLYEGQTKLLISDNNSGYSYNFKIGYELIGGKTYYIRVSGNTTSVTGNYSLCVSSGFTSMLDGGYILTGEEEIVDSKFHMCMTPLNVILKRNGISYLYDSNNCKYNVDLYYDDWYLYSIGDKETQVYGLIKMREQENDYDQTNEGDDPGVTISFVELDISIFMNCLKIKNDGYRVQLYNEINKVVANENVKYSDVMYNYFSDVKSNAPYFIADEYIKKIAKTAKYSNGKYYLTIPINCKDIISKYNQAMGIVNSVSSEGSLFDETNEKVLDYVYRIPEAMKKNNTLAGYNIYSNNEIIIKNVNNLSLYEKYAILMSHTGNVNFNSFAAEVEFHADALKNNVIQDNEFTIFAFGIIAKEKLSKQWYNSAIRADMAIGEEFRDGITDKYYDLNSNIVKMQASVHGSK